FNVSRQSDLRPPRQLESQGKRDRSTPRAFVARSPWFDAPPPALFNRSSGQQRRRRRARARSAEIVVDGGEQLLGFFLLEAVLGGDLGVDRGVGGDDLVEELLVGRLVLG